MDKALRHLTPMLRHGNALPERREYAMKGSVRFYPGRGWVVQYYDPREHKRIFKTFKHQDDAELFQAHLNVSNKEGKLDARDYAKDNPMGLRSQAEKYLAHRKTKVKDVRHQKATSNELSPFLEIATSKKYSMPSWMIFWSPYRKTSPQKRNTTFSRHFMHFGHGFTTGKRSAGS
jgi:hypothetical protein